MLCWAALRGRVRRLWGSAVVMVETFLATWYLSVVPAVIFVKTALVGTRRLKSVLAELDSVVETPGDMLRVREAVNTNMLLAVLMVAEFAAFLLAWALVSLVWLNLPVVIMHSLVFASASAAVGLRARKVEREFRQIRVAPFDPSAADTLETWLRQWRGLRLLLPD